MSNTSKNKKDYFNQLIEAIADKEAVDIVNYLLLHSLKSGSSEIIIEPKKGIAEIILKIDGVLHNIASYHEGLHDVITSRIKILAGLQSDEKRYSQRGIIETDSKNGLGVRIITTTFPSEYGERICMIIQDDLKHIPTLKELGVRGSGLKKIENTLKGKNGCILIGGELGSGRSTTGYSMLKNKTDNGVKAAAIDVYSKLESDNIIKSFSRKGDTEGLLNASSYQLFDMIMVGNIDKKEIINKVYKNGNNVLSLGILKSNGSFDMLDKFYNAINHLDNGSFSLNTPLLITSQKLVRRLCENCKEGYGPSEKELDIIKKELEGLPESEGLDISEIDNVKLFKAKGCSECMNIGYKGRMGVFEVLDVDYDLSCEIEKGGYDLDELEKKKKREGFVTMKQDGFIKAVAGYTTIDEVLKD